MQGLLRQFWRWLKRLLGLDTSLGSKKTYSEAPALADTDYEFLFMQLLEGVAHGWHEGRILKFFQKVEERSSQRDWVNWLESFGAKVLGTNAPNQQLAIRMIRLGELARAFPEIEQIGDTSYSIGRELYYRNSAEVIWEYTGPDENPEPEATPLPAPQALSEEELYHQLEKDSILAKQIAHQLGLESADPATIVEALKEQFLRVQAQIESQDTPDTVEGWFDRGLHYASLGNWEQAIADWDQALALDPNLPQALHNKGGALAMLGRFAEALPYFEQALALDGEDFQIWNGKGSALYNLQRWQESLECWDQSLRLNPDFYQGWYNRGCTLENLGDVQGAIDSFQKSLDLQPDFNLAQAKIKDLLVL
jgi:tetratricopeptide (TPR) repeat protein